VPRWRVALAVAAVLAAAGLLVGGQWDRIAPLWKELSTVPERPGMVADRSPDRERPSGDAADRAAPAGQPPPRPGKPPAFPRRLLAISVNNYLFANPVSNGELSEEGSDRQRPRAGQAEAQRGIHTVVKRLADALHVADSQVTLLSDAAPSRQARPPLRAVIESTVNQFLESCRAQDRVVLLFVGHAADCGEEACLVPIDGEPAVKETLVPLAWLYERLAACKAQEKLLIVDVCRFNPSRGLERPGTGPMGPRLDTMLSRPPPGVRVWSACVGGQYSYEGSYELAKGVSVSGGFFLLELAEALGAYQRRMDLGAAEPDEPLPVELLAHGDGGEIRAPEGTKRANGVHAGTVHAAQDAYQARQTPRLSGEPAATRLPFDPDEPLPLSLEIRLPRPEDGEPADRAVVQRLLDEVDGATNRAGAGPLRAEALPPFSADRLAAYAADDGMQTSFREQVLRATAMLRKHAKALKTEFSTDEATRKAQILREQREPGRADAELRDQRETLQELEPEKANEPSPRWRASYDYVVASLDLQRAFLYEYNYMLGQMRKEALPRHDPAKHKHWRLAATAALQSGSEAKKLAADAKKRLEKLAREHVGTPWEVLAKRRTLTAVGLEWQPCP
jgi:hypothetical protein